MISASAAARASRACRASLPSPATSQATHVRTFASISNPSPFQRRRHPAESVWEPVTHNIDQADDVVPLYYIERKRARDAISKRKEEEEGLMYELSTGILADGIAAEMRRPGSKIPTEYKHSDGRLLHASGFVVPAPGVAPVRKADQRDRNPLIQTADVLERVQEESLLMEAAEDGVLDGNTKRQQGKIPFEVEESDGSVRHPSGFIPPTPMTGFTKREFHAGRRLM